MQVPKEGVQSISDVKNKHISIDQKTLSINGKMSPIPTGKQDMGRNNNKMQKYQTNPVRVNNIYGRKDVSNEKIKGVA